MKKFFTTLTLALFCASLLCPAVCRAEKTVKENRETGTFRKISAQLGFEVHFTQSDSYSLVVEAEEDLIKDVITETKGETLSLYFSHNEKKSMKNNGKRTIKIHVSAPALDEIDLSTGISFHADNLKCNKSFRIKASTGVVVSIENLTAGETVDINTSTGVVCNIKKLKAGECNVTSSTGSVINADVDISGDLSINASAGSVLKIEGKAKDVSVTASEASRVKLTNMKYSNIDTNSSDLSSISY
jgi:hypothetical protein